MLFALLNSFCGPEITDEIFWLLLWDRLQLAKVIPGLRPWEVLSIEQAMDQITYGGEWYREPLGTHRTGPPYIKYWNSFVKVHTLSTFCT